VLPAAKESEFGQVVMSAGNQIPKKGRGGERIRATLGFNHRGAFSPSQRSCRTSFRPW